MEVNRYRSLRGAGKSMERCARAATLLLWLAGLYSFLTTVRPILPDAPHNLTWGERRVVGVVALITLGGFGLAGWVAGRLLRAGAELIEVFVDGAQAAVQTSYLIETRLVPGITRLAAALESFEAAAGGLETLSAGVRKATRERRWGRAERLLDAARRDDPHSTEIAALAAEVDRAQQAEVAGLVARLDAARGADDPDQVITCRDALTQHLRGGPLRDLDRRVVRWLTEAVERRARSGPATTELAALAARVADSFGDTPEGAALLATVPDLRRRAGLCPDCAHPYRGKADACPDCLRGRQGPAPLSRPEPGGRTAKGTS